MSPLYVAVICWEPPRNVVGAVVMLALPLPSNVAVPRVNPLVVSLNVTVPVGVGPDVEFTFAEKVTGWPKVEGFGLAEAVTFAPDPSTTWVSTVEVLVA